MVEYSEDVSALRFMLNGSVVGGLAYGIHLTLFLECLYLLLLHPTEEKIKRHLVIFISANFTLGTTHFVAQMKFNEMLFIDGRGYPGGALGIWFNNYGNFWNIIAFATAFVSNWITDALLIYRLFIFWSSSWKIIVFPCLALTGSIVLSLLLLMKIARPTEAFWNFLAVRLGSSYWALTIAINVYVTTLIIGRIWYLQRNIDQILSPSPPSTFRSRLNAYFGFGRSKGEGSRPNSPTNFEQGAGNGSASRRVSLGKRERGMVSSVATMLLESAALLTIIEVIFEGAYATKSPLMDLFFPVFGHIGSVTSLLIIVRVARGTAWTRNEVVELSSIKFS